MDLDSQTARHQASQEREERLNIILRADEMQTILAVQQAITSHLDPNDVLQMIADEARRLTSAEMSAVYLLKEDQLEISVVSGAVGKDLLGWKIPMDSSVAGRAILSNEAFLVADTEQEAAIHSRLVEKVAARSFVIVPLMSGDGPIGTITVANRSPNSLSEHDRRLLMMLTPGAVIALDNARLYEQAQQVAAVEERQRLARDLHDAVTQTLFSATLIADVLPRLWLRSPEEGQVRLEELRQLTRGALAEMRSLLMELRPSALVELDFDELLSQLCDAFTAQTQIPVFFNQAGKRNLPQDVQIVLYRVAQETLNNMSKLANASQVDVSCSCSREGIDIFIQDNGSGSLSADEFADQMGIILLNERAACVGACIEIANQTGKGAAVSIRWPNQRKITKNLSDRSESD